MSDWMIVLGWILVGFGLNSLMVEISRYVVAQRADPAGKVPVPLTALANHLGGLLLAFMLVLSAHGRSWLALGIGAIAVALTLSGLFSSVREINPEIRQSRR